MNSEQILKHISTELMLELLNGSQIVFYHHAESNVNNFILLKRKFVLPKLNQPRIYFVTYQLTTEENGSKYILASTIGEKMTDRQAVRVAKLLTKQITETNPLFKKIN